MVSMDILQGYLMEFKHNVRGHHKGLGGAMDV